MGISAPGVKNLSPFMSNKESVCSVHLFHLVLVIRVTLLASEKSLAVLVESEVGDLDVGGVDGDLSLLSVHLLLDEFLNVDAPFAAVNFNDFAFTVLVGSTDDLDHVSASDGDGTSEVLSGELLGELGGHHLSTDGRRSGEVGLSRLSALAGNLCIDKRQVVRMDYQGKRANVSRRKTDSGDLRGLVFIF